MKLRVIYNDIYNVSVRDAKVIADSVGNPADHYLLGDIDSILDFLKTNSIECNGVISSDVIEHIYDIRGFFENISKIKSNALSIVMCSGANPFHHTYEEH